MSKAKSTRPAEVIGLDREHTRFTSLIIPYSIERVWPHFESYFELQSFLHAVQEDASNLRLEGPQTNGVGTIIAFEWRGSTVREELVEKDDHTHTWSIIVPGETEVFRRYRATVALSPITRTGGGSGATFASLELKMILQRDDQAEAIFSRVDALIAQRLPRLVEFIHLKNGYQTLEVVSEMDLPAERLWKIVSDWSDTSWVLGARAVEVDPRDPYLRKITFDDHELIERLVMKDDDTRTLTYQLLAGRFPVTFYRGTIQLEPSGGGRTRQRYTLLFVPEKGADAGAVKSAVEARLRAGAEFINRTLGRCSQA